MKRFRYLMITALFVCCRSVAASAEQKTTDAEQLNSVLNVRDPANYTYPTKFGDLKFVRSDGKLGVPSETITLGDKVLLSVKGQFDQQGGGLQIMSEIFSNTSWERAPRRTGQLGHTDTKRMVVLLGADLNCVKNFVILDFTGSTPFVSEKFGNNAEDRFCIDFKKAKWGKKESEIILKSGETYIYNTLHDVTGPFVFE